MTKSKRKRTPKAVLKLPDLEQSKSAVLNSLTSPSSQRSYDTAGTLLRSINKAGRIWGTGFTPKVIWGVVKEKAKECETPSLALHNLRRTCARLCHQAGGELEQIQFLLGHVSVQTTERYLGCKQRFRNAVNDRIAMEPDSLGTQ
jgi:integrase